MKVFKEAFRRFVIRLIYSLIWFLFFILIGIIVLYFFSGSASASYDAYNTTSPPGNTYLNAFINDDCDYVIFYSAENKIMAVKGELSFYDGSFHGINVDCCTYITDYNSRIYTHSTISEFALSVDENDLIYSNLGYFADIRGGRLNETNANKIIFAVAFGCGLLLLYFVVRNIFPGR